MTSNDLMGESTPIFLCGYPKSGTTLLLSLLDSHRELLVLPEESFFLTRIINYPDRQNIEYLIDHTGIMAFGYGKFEWQSGNRDYSGLDFSIYVDRVRDLWQSHGSTKKALLESAFLAYGEITGQTNKKYWVEKTPLNELYLMDATFIWPDLHALYIIRDPRDNYCTYKRKREYDSKDFSINEFVEGWNKSVYAWESFVSSSSETLLIRYEDLTSFPEVELRRVCGFLNLNWDDILMQPTRNGLPWSGNSIYGGKFDRITSDSVKKYKTLLSSGEIRVIERELGDVMKRYNYSPDYPEKSIHSFLYKITHKRKQ